MTEASPPLAPPAGLPHATAPAPGIAALTRELELNTDRIAALAAEIRTRDAELVALRDEVRALRGSTSWRITAPLRAAVRLLRRGG